MEPLFIIGMGRSGSTILHQSLSKHENLAWLTPALQYFPNKYYFNRLSLHLNDLPILGRMISSKNRPGEYYKIWDNIFPGFSTPFRDLTKDDVTNRVKKNYHDIFQKITTRKRKKLLFKITGWPRIFFIKELYPDAKFIYIKRNEFAVVNSLLNVNWWWGWRGTQNWRFGLLPNKYQKIWESYNYSFVALASIEYKLISDKIEASKQKNTNISIFEVEYEELCKNPLNVIENICNYSNIDFTDKFAKKIEKIKYINTNFKYKSELTDNQINIISSILGITK